MNKQKRFWVKIKLLSPLCAATGDGIGGLVDVEIAHEYGLPIIPAKRLKGCLAAAGKELAAYDEAMRDALGKLFGLPGQATGGALQIEDAHLFQVPDFSAADAGDRKGSMIKIEDYPKLLALLKRYNRAPGGGEARLSAEDALICLTDPRARTAIDAVTKSAKKGALYTLRAARRGLVFRARATLRYDDKRGRLEDTLEQCAKGLRQMGLGSARGLGEVRCCLAELKETKEPAAAEFQFPAGAAQDTCGELQFCLELKTPLMVAGEDGLYASCADWIPGGAILGALANMYIEDKNLRGAAHTDPTFRDIFLRGRVKFGYAFPADGDLEVFYPCPKAIQRDKRAPIYYNVAGPIPPEAQPRGERRFARFSGGALQLYETKKEIRMHHARPRDRSIGHAARDDRDGQSATGDGQFYQYVSLSAGQRFCGVWQGKREHIRLLLGLLRNRGNQLLLGRSRAAEYGVAAFQPLRFAPIKNGENPAARTCEPLLLYLATPLVLRDAAGRESLDPRLLLDEINQTLSCDLNLQSQWIGCATLAGYHAKWRLPKQQTAALAAGTSLLVTGAGQAPGIIREIEARRWGQRKGEGCGMLRAISSQQLAAMADGLTGVVWEEEIADKNADESEETHPLITMLIQQKDRRASDCRDMQAALSVKLPPPEPSIVAYLTAALDATDGSYSALYEEAGKIKNQDKKEKVQAFLKGCDGKSKAFIETYLKRAKWLARSAR